MIIILFHDINSSILHLLVKISRRKNRKIDNNNPYYILYPDDFDFQADTTAASTIYTKLSQNHSTV